MKAPKNFFLDHDSDDGCHGGCSEYSGLSRRNFLHLGAGLLTTAAMPAWLPRVALADSHHGGRDVIVSIFLRGGWDGLTVCAPFGDARYAELRPNLAVAPPDASGNRRSLDLDGFFGFAPAMEPLLEAYQAGDLLLVQACGLETSTRSHFDAMRLVEFGQGEAPAVGTGWLGRHLASTAPTLADAVLRAVALGPGLPMTLAGAPAALPIPDLANFGLLGDLKTASARGQALREMYAHANEAMSEATSSTFGTFDLLDRIDFEGYSPAASAVYPESDFGKSLKSTAALIKAEVGVEAIAVDFGGWDTHGRQEPFEGRMAGLMSDFSGALAAFRADLDVASTRVTTVVMSEFGRNAAENGSGGTDHGHGGLMMVLSPGVHGGRVLGDWPGLAPHQLYEGQDLAITTDYRDVLSEILSERLGNANPAAVFDDPSYRARALGIF